LLYEYEGKHYGKIHFYGHHQILLIS